MIKIKDIAGQRFGRLVAVSPIKREGDRNYYWECRCDCGNTVTVNGYNLRSGNTQSCGCFQKEKSIKISTTHGLRRSPLYHIWSHIKDRCFNKNNPRYKDYGGRGITVCDRWLDFKNFHDDMFPTWKRGLSIDRINNDGNYGPGNCRWATNKDQNNNRRDNCILELDGKRMTVTQWAEKLNINRNTLYDRIYISGWSIKRALFTPIKSI